MGDVKGYRCPSCGAVLAYAPGTSEVRCANCGKSIPVAILDTMQADAGENASFDWGDYKQQLSGQHLQNTKVYQCKSCGAEIEADATTAATRCPYCDSNVVLTDRVSGGLRPNAVIPFKITPKELPDAVNRFYKNKKLIPKNFFDKSRLSKVQGVYVPFWLYDCRLAGRVNLSATTVRMYSDAHYDYTETTEYLLARAGEMSFENVPVDASVKMDNDLMDSLEPFDFSEMVDFNDAYLAGYVADRFDSDPDAELPRANERMMRSADAAFAAAEGQYESVSIQNNAMQIADAGVKYVLLPVYLLHCEYNGKKYQYAVNGQTGKVVGELPVSKSRVWEFFLKGFGIAAAVAFGLGMLLQ